MAVVILSKTPLMLCQLPTRRLCLLESKLLWRPTFNSMLSENAHTHAVPRPSSSNKHLSVDAEGNTQVGLKFIEEPLGLSAEQGHGYLRIEFGDLIGLDHRYKVVQKLGWGMNSSVWMAFNEKCVQLISSIDVMLTMSTEKRYMSRSKL
jgi:hypothetical protein